MNLLIAAFFFLALIVILLVISPACKRKPSVNDESEPPQRQPVVPPKYDAWLEYAKTDMYKSQHQKCKDKLKDIKDMIGDEQLKLLAIGRQGVGKSSFLNTLMKACDQTDSSGIEQVFVPAQSDNHVSQRFTGHIIGGTRLFLVDSIGVRQLGEDQFTYDSVWESLFQGRVGVGDNIEYVENFDERDSEGRLTTAQGKPYDGAFLVEDGTEAFGDGQNLAFARKIAETRGGMAAPIPIVGVVTKIDNLGSNFSDFVELADKNEVTDAVAHFQRHLFVPCFPVRCYDETFKYNDPWINYNVLDVLQYIVEQAVKFKRRKAEESQRETESPRAPQKYGKIPKGP